MAHFPSKITIEPLSDPVSAVVSIPGSKSITNRALLIAALATGETVLHGALFSDDTRFMAQALGQLGIRVLADEQDARFAVIGGNGSFPAQNADLFVGNSGTTMRFLVAALPLGHGRYRIDGIPRMRQRPIGPLLRAMIDLGASAQTEFENSCPPVVVDGSGLEGGSTRMSGTQSSQYFSALLLSAPYARKGVEIEVEGDLVSKPYMPMTTKVMADFSVDAEIDLEKWAWFRVAPGQRYQGRSYQIEPDASNASYFFAAAAIAGGKVRVDGLGTESPQGDLGFVRVLEKMGATVKVTREFTEVQGPPRGTLQGVDLDLNAISDTAQTLSAIAPFASSPTTIRGIGHARLKETDRVAAVATELRKMGQKVEEFEDGLRIIPQPIRAAEIGTYDDHRMAMSFAIAGLAAPDITILEPGCVSKTFPSFFETLDSLRR